MSKAESKKVEEAREFLKKHPIPEHLLKRQGASNCKFYFLGVIRKTHNTL